MPGSVQKPGPPQGSKAWRCRGEEGGEEAQSPCLSAVLPTGTTVEGTVTSAGGTRNVGCTEALRTASPTSPSECLARGWDGSSTGPFLHPHPSAEYFVGICS